VDPGRLWVCFFAKPVAPALVRAVLLVLVGDAAASGLSGSFFALRVEARTAFFAQRSRPFSAFLMSAQMWGNGGCLVKESTQKQPQNHYYLSVYLENVRR
jgi:hypothetical protein